MIWWAIPLKARQGTVSCRARNAPVNWDVEVDGEVEVCAIDT
jgi:hypothetical protein